VDIQGENAKPIALDLCLSSLGATCGDQIAYVPLWLPYLSIRRNPDEILKSLSREHYFENYSQGPSHGYLLDVPGEMDSVFHAWKILGSVLSDGIS
jgi:hypothetical protein